MTDEPARTLRSSRNKKGGKKGSAGTSTDVPNSAAFEPGPSYICMSASVGATDDDCRLAQLTARLNQLEDGRKHMEAGGLSQSLHLNLGNDKSWELTMLYEEKDRLQNLNKMVMQRMTQEQAKVSSLVGENEHNKAEIGRLTAEIEALKAAQASEKHLDQSRSTEMELKDKYFRMKEAELAEKIREINDQSEKNTLIVVESDKLNQQQRNEIARLQKSQESLMSQLRALKEDFENQQNEYELTLNSLKAAVDQEKNVNLDLTYQVKSLQKSLERVEEEKMSLMTEYEMSEITLNKTSSNATTLDKHNRQLQLEIDELKHKTSQQELCNKNIFDLKEQEIIKKSSLISELKGKLALLETQYSESTKLNAVEIERLKEFQQSLIAQLAASKELSAKAQQDAELECQELKRQLEARSSELETMKLQNQESSSSTQQLQAALEEATGKFEESNEASQRNLSELESVKAQLREMEAKKLEETAYLKKELDMIAQEFDKLVEQAKRHQEQTKEAGKQKDDEMVELTIKVRELEADQVAMETRMAESECAKQEEIGQLQAQLDAKDQDVQKLLDQLASQESQLKELAKKDAESFEALEQANQANQALEKKLAEKDGLDELVSTLRSQIYESNTCLHAARGEMSLLQDSIVSINLAHERQCQKYEARIKDLDSAIQELKQEYQRKSALDQEAIAKQKEEIEQLSADKQSLAEKQLAAQESWSKAIEKSDELAASCQKQSEEIDELVAQLSNLNAAKNELLCRKQAELYEAKVCMSERLEQEQATVKQVVQEKEQLEQSLVDARAQLASLEEAQRLSAEQFASQIAQLEATIESQTGELETADSTLKTIRQANDAYARDMMDKERRIEQLQRWIDLVEEYLLDLEREHKLQAREQHKLAQTVDQFYAEQLDKYQAELAQLGQEHAAFLRDYEQAQTERDQLQVKLSEAEEQQEQLQTELYHLSSVREQLAETNVQLGQQFESLKLTNDQNLSVIAELKENIQRVEFIGASSFMEMQRMQAELDAANIKLGNLEESNSNYGQMFKAVEEEKSELASRLEFLTQTNQDLEGKMAEISEAKAALATELEQVKSTATDQAVEMERLSNLRAEISKNALRDLELKDQELAAKEDEIKSLTELVDSQRAAIDELNGRFELVVSSQKEYLDACKAMEVELPRLKEQVEQEQATTAQLRSSLADATSLLDKSSSRVAELEQEQSSKAQEICELSESLEQLQRAHQQSTETHQADLMSKGAEIEELKEQLNKMFENQDVLINSEEVLIERLNGQFAKMQTMLEHSQKLQEKYAEQDELVAKLDMCLNESKAVVNQLMTKVNTLAQELEQARAQYEQATKEKDSLSQEMESAASTIQSQSAKIDELHKMLDELMAKHEQSEADKSAKIQTLTQEIDELRHELSKSAEERARREKEQEAVQQELLAKFKADKAQMETHHQSKCKQFESNIGCLLDEIQTLKKALAALEKTNSLKLSELGDKVNEIAELRNEKSQTESKLRKMRESYEEQYKSTIGKLNAEFAQKCDEYEAALSKLQSTTDFFRDAHTKAEVKLQETKSALADFQAKNSELAQEASDQRTKIKQLEARVAELAEESQRFSESYQAAKKRLDEVKDLKQTINQELTSVKASLADTSHQLRTAETEKQSLKNQKEALVHELNELKLKSTQETSTREELHKIAISFKQQFEMLQKQHATLKQSYDEQEAELKQLQLRSASNAMSGALSSLIEKQSESSVQAKIDDLTDQRQRHLVEIESLRAEIEQMKAKMASEADRLNQEHQKSAMDKQHQYEKSLGKRMQEIKKLRETTKEMQETNDFLANQITNLNKLIYDLNHGGSGKENNDTSTVGCKTPLGASKMANDMVTPVVNKNLLGVKDMNKLAAKPSSNELASKASTDSIPMTPSSTIRKQNQCAQQ